MTSKYELTHEEYSRISDLLPDKNRTGRPWLDHRQVLNGMLWILHTGAQWRMLPKKYGKWRTVHNRFRRWTDDKTLERILNRLRLDLNDSGRIDHRVWNVDSTVVRASRSAAGAKKKRSRR